MRRQSLERRWCGIRVSRRRGRNHIAASVDSASGVPRPECQRNRSEDPAYVSPALFRRCVIVKSVRVPIMRRCDGPSSGSPRSHLRTYQSIGLNPVLQSIVVRLRRQRFQILEKMIAVTGPGPLTILDIGGTEEYWRCVSDGGVHTKLRITLLNVGVSPVIDPSFTSVAGDARAMPEFADKQFDIVFSNSTIEHVGDFSDQMRMANEVRRIGRRYCVQTPNRYFPVEPHFIFPFLQFLPVAVRVELILGLRLGWYGSQPLRQQVLDDVRSIRLISRTELQRLFPDATIVDERWYGLAKSFVACGPS